MGICVLCEKKLTMWNVSSKSVRVLKDGSEVCASCLQLNSKLIPNLRVKDYDLSALKLAIKEAIEQMQLKREKINNLQFGKVDEGGIKKTLKELQNSLNDS